MVSVLIIIFRIITITFAKQITMYNKKFKCLLYIQDGYNALRYIFLSCLSN